jgi:O-antigen ligase
MTTACDKVTGPADGGLGQHASYVTQNLSKRPTLFDMRPGLRIIGALVSFESVFILFLICGSYKTDPRFSSLPIDLNVLFFAAGIAMGLVIIYREGIYLPGLTVVALLIVFIAWALLTSVWTPSELYAHEKLLKLTTLNLWSVMASAMIIANRPQRVRRFLLLLLVFGTAAAIDGIMQYGGAGPLAGTASFRLHNYGAQGRLYGMAGIVAFAAWLHTNPFSKVGMALMAAVLTCACGMLVTGSRGATLGVLAGMLLPLALGLRFADRRLLASKTLVASVVFFVALAAVLVNVAANSSGDLPTLQRFDILLTEEEGGQAHRLWFWRRSWDFWLAHPLFGSGVGSFGILAVGIDRSSHPHNLILEVLVEFGLIGLLLITAVAVAALRRTSVHRLREDPALMCAAMLCICTLIYAMTSSDITGNRNVFAMLGLLVMRPYIRTSSVGSESRAPERFLDVQQVTPNSGRGRI